MGWAVPALGAAGEHQLLWNGADEVVAALLAGAGTDPGVPWLGERGHRQGLLQAPSALLPGCCWRRLVAVFISQGTLAPKRDSFMLVFTDDIPISPSFFLSNKCHLSQRQMSQPKH